MIVIPVVFGFHGQLARETFVSVGTDECEPNPIGRKNFTTPVAMRKIDLATVQAVLAVVNSDLITFAIKAEFPKGNPIAKAAHRTSKAWMGTEVTSQRIEDEVHIGKIPRSIRDFDFEQGGSPVHHTDVTAVPVGKREFVNGESVFGLAKRRGRDAHKCL